ncbi:D-alanine--D-alanine ligase [Vibrio ostreicida]|uniref:D-alanine--D-alanine ligase n=1 Tax=Vibrio ostreicida TaxID=526588 RepID=A0ABT8BZV5_9VIBR|nr:D-alanine--D-alanine ligase [Vibrio ostreicida]MDN3612223.1 D-alanine--D-alanine ligase [Vibrio ostreicida]NPD08613.1 D-alanine--D-alanine ligase [Vibrio ostreicida]
MTQLDKIDMIPQGKVNAGMPVLRAPKRVISPFEFLPAWFVYAPVVLQSVALSVYHRDWALPLIANPAIKLSGMVGESKDEIFRAAGDTARQWILPFITLEKPANDHSALFEQALKQLKQNHLCYPLVAKPDLGCRGVGVKLINSDQQLQDYIADFPSDGRFLIQERSNYCAEAGVFYVRQPGESQGKIISITLKYSPKVVGDGHATLKQLIERCPRAGQLQHLYLPRHYEHLDRVIGKGDEFQLAFAGSHSRGCIFRDGNQFITESLARKLDQILGEFEGFHYGRLDVKFHDIQSFMRGESFDILEINGASSEAAHIWDSDTTLPHIFSTLLKQYRLLYQIGSKHKQQGYQTPSLRALMQAWREEKLLTQLYPMTD